MFGRIMKKKQKSVDDGFVNRTVRFSKELDSLLEVQCSKEFASKSVLIRKAVIHYVKEHSPEEFAEYAKEKEGSIMR